MGIQEFYSSIGVDSANLLSRLSSEILVKKYLLKLLDDPTFASLSEAFQKKDYEQAFRSVHTLKGISANLELIPLLNGCIELTETLRGGNPDPEVAEDLYQRVESCYLDLLSKIQLIK